MYTCGLSGDASGLGLLAGAELRGQPQSSLHPLFRSSSRPGEAAGRELHFGKNQVYFFHSTSSLGSEDLCLFDFFIHSSCFPEEGRQSSFRQERRSALLLIPPSCAQDGNTSAVIEWIQVNFICLPVFFHLPGDCMGVRIASGQLLLGYCTILREQVSDRGQPCLLCGSCCSPCAASSPFTAPLLGLPGLWQGPLNVSQLHRMVQAWQAMRRSWSSPPASPDRGWKWISVRV